MIALPIWSKGQAQVSGCLSRRIAIDTEFADWVLNRYEEDWFTIRGLPRLGNLSQQEWQFEARRQVKMSSVSFFSATRST